MKIGGRAATKVPKIPPPSLKLPKKLDLHGPPEKRTAKFHSSQSCRRVVSSSNCWSLSQRGYTSPGGHSPSPHVPLATPSSARVPHGPVAAPCDVADARRLFPPRRWGGGGAFTRTPPPPRPKRDRRWISADESSAEGGQWMAVSAQPNGRRQTVVASMAVQVQR